MGNGANGGGVVEEQRDEVATGAAAGEAEFEALNPVGCVGNLGGPLQGMLIGAPFLCIWGGTLDST